MPMESEARRMIAQEMWDLMVSVREELTEFRQELLDVNHDQFIENIVDTGERDLGDELLLETLRKMRIMESNVKSLIIWRVLFKVLLMKTRESTD